MLHHTTKFGSFFEVTIIPTLRDNYCYLVRCLHTNHCALVDVGEAAPVQRVLQKIAAQSYAIFSTHKHTDHCGGNAELKRSFPSMEVYGHAIDAVEACTKRVKDGDEIPMGELTVKVMHTPCHTKGHVLYHFFNKQAPEQGAVFTGDTIFVGGIGAFFEGNAQQMLEACRQFVALPPPTAVYPGHEYTLNFLKFAASKDAHSDAIKEKLKRCEDLRRAGQPTVPSTVGEEIQTNLFLRCDDNEWRRKCNVEDPVSCMQHLYDVCP